jgi:hypothetical protein
VLEGLELLINALIPLAGLLILNKASNGTITNSVKIAEITGFGKTTVGVILVAFLYYGIFCQARNSAGGKARFCSSCTSSFSQSVSEASKHRCKAN